MIPSQHVPPMACFNSENVNRLQLYCVGRLLYFVHLLLYRSLKLTFPLDIGGLSRDGIIKSEMGLSSME